MATGEREAKLRRVPGAAIPHILVHLLIEGFLDVAVQRTVTRNALQRRCVEVRDIIPELVQGQLRRMHVPWATARQPGHRACQDETLSQRGREAHILHTRRVAHLLRARGRRARAARTQKPPSFEQRHILIRTDNAVTGRRQSLVLRQPSPLRHAFSVSPKEKRGALLLGAHCGPERTPSRSALAKHSRQHELARGRGKRACPR